jgi:hypothetical protein
LVPDAEQGAGVGEKEMSGEETIRLLQEEFIALKTKQTNYDLRVTNYDLLLPGEPATGNQNHALPGEIIFGRMINTGVELSLTDQLVASTAFIRNILQTKNERKPPGEKGSSNASAVSGIRRVPPEIP